MEPATIISLVIYVGLPALGFLVGVWKSNTKNKKTKKKLEKVESFFKIIVRGVEASGINKDVKAKVKQLAIRDDVYDELDTKIHEVV